jgi:rod shape-determining protein MreC
MRNILLFIRRYSNFVFFLVLFAASLVMLFRYNRFHESSYLAFQSEWAGRVNIRYNSVEQYFSLKAQNDELRRQNAELLNRLRSDFESPDTSVRTATGSPYDTTEAHRKFLYLPAKVISNSVSSQKNHLMLHRGSEQGVEPNMAVVSPSGVVGSVVNVSGNMSVVMSLLHQQSRVVAVLSKGSGFGEVSWDGKDPRYVQLNKIPRTVTVNKGDTVVTSQYSDKYPPGYLLGFVETVSQDTETGTYLLIVRTAVDFTDVQHAFVVRNMQRAEMEALKKIIK